MPITGVTEEAYREYLCKGGTLTFEIDSSDIDNKGGFEESPLIAPDLTSGFELKPSDIFDEPDNSAALFLYGGSWTRVVAHTYKHGGKIVYKKIQNGRYQAIATIPAKKDNLDDSENIA
jgi:hypothetical protein